MHLNEPSQSVIHQRPLEIHSPDDYEPFVLHPELPTIPLDWLQSHQPDAHWVVLDQRTLTARCSLWWRSVPESQFGRAGLIGHYAAVDDSSAAVLLPWAMSQLRQQDCRYVIGPMNQNTWRDYRFITWGESRGRFFMEPSGSPQEYRHFLMHGFRHVAQYTSSIASDLSQRRTGLDRVRINMDRKGIRIRCVDESSFETDLKKVFRVVCQVFRDNTFYVPVQEQEFVAMYRPLKNLLANEMVLVAEHGSEIVAFCFAVPDLAQVQLGQPIDTVVFKTFGAMPQPCYQGLGQILLEEVHRRAAERGFRHVIHALIRDPSPTQRIVARYGKTFRRYALLGRELSI